MESTESLSKARIEGPPSGIVSVRAAHAWSNWAFWTAVVLSTATAALHTFVLAGPTLSALALGNADAEAQQGLRMMWNDMSAMFWFYPIALLLARRMPPETTRAGFGLVALLNAAQALFYAGFVLIRYDASVTQLLLQLTLHAGVAGSTWLARPPKSPLAPKSADRKRWHLVLTWTGIAIGSILAGYHMIAGTFYMWPAAVLASDTAMPAKMELYVMWLFSCVVFAAVPASLLWSLRTSAGPGRFVVRFVACMIALLMTSWALNLTLGLGESLPPTGAIVLGLLAALTALGAPPRPASTV